jgi:broad specificity phosphatase PhoE
MADFRTVTLLRHAAQEKTDDVDGGMWQPQAPLTEEGCRAMRRLMGQRMADRQYRHIWSSSFVRAKKTAAMLRLTGVEIVISRKLEPNNLSLWDRHWETLTKLLGHDPDTPDFETHLPAFMLEHKICVASALFSVRDQLKPGEYGLVVTHDPMATLVWDLMDPKYQLGQSPPLGKSEGLDFVFNEVGGWRIEHLKVDAE